jgi:hypothetical protein
MKVKPKGRKAKKVGSVTNGRGKGNSKNVDLSTLSVDDFMNSTLDESGDSDIDNDNNSPYYVTRAMNEDHQEEGMYRHCVCIEFLYVLQAEVAQMVL